VLVEKKRLRITLLGELEKGKKKKSRADFFRKKDL